MRIGTRGSELATTQTNTVITRLGQLLGLEIETAIIQTQGDRVSDRPLRELKGRGFLPRKLKKPCWAARLISQSTPLKICHLNLRRD